MGNTLLLELQQENPRDNSYFYTTLGLPASRHEIRDACQRARIKEREIGYQNISIVKSYFFPQLADIKLDSPTIEELNFFAGRLDQMVDKELRVLQAVAKQFLHSDEDELVRMKDLINMTYGLENVPVIEHVTTDKQLGRFVIMNDMHEDIMAVSEQSLYLLDQQKIGKLQRENEKGEFSGQFYIAAGQYKMPEVYDGEHLPNSVPVKDSVFSLLIAEAPENGAEETADSAEWLRLPVNQEEANRIARVHYENCIEDCVYYAFKSSIPQITEELFGDMHDFAKLNRLAGQITALSSDDEVKFKAALCAEKPGDLDGVLALLHYLPAYEFSSLSNNEGSFFKEYLCVHLGADFDYSWFDGILTLEKGKELIQKLGASLTGYGVISARGRSLYELLPNRGVEVETAAPQLDNSEHSPDFLSEELTVSIFDSEALNEDQGLQMGGI